MKFRFAISISAVALLFSALLTIEAQGQVCDYSVNTFVVVDDSGTPIDGVKIEPVSSESYNPTSGNTSKKRARSIAITNLTPMFCSVDWVARTRELF